MNFDGFLGNGLLKEQFSALFAAGRLPHALILEGAPGSGKGTLARILAQALVCRGEAEKPCGQCAPCQKVVGGFHPDVTEVSGGSAARSFHIDEVRKWRSDANLRPNEAECKVYIFKSVENMSDGAGNALLKVLEEPPGHVYFFLTCVSSAALLSTILSRAPVFKMGEVEEREALALLRELFPETEEADLRRVAALSDGNLGRMIEGLSDGAFRTAADLSGKLAQAVVAQKEMELLSLAAPLCRDKELMRSVLAMMLLLFRDGCMCRGGFADGLSGDGETLELLRSRLTQAQLLDMIEILGRAQSALAFGANQPLLATWLCAMLRERAERK